MAVATSDVNGDGLPDIYVLRGSTTTETNAPDVMLLNGGDGVGFQAMPVPGDPGGLADAVEPIDYDGNGLTDFLVLNGNGLHTTPGAAQLIAFFPQWACPDVCLTTVAWG